MNLGRIIIGSSIAIVLLAALGIGLLVQITIQNNPQKVFKEPIVYAVKDIPEGTIIKKDQIDVSRYDKPASASAMVSLVDVIGHKAKYGIQSGQIVSKYDLEK